MEVNKTKMCNNDDNNVEDDDDNNDNETSRLWGGQTPSAMRMPGRLLSLWTTVERVLQSYSE